MMSKRFAAFYRFELFRRTTVTVALISFLRRFCTSRRLFAHQLKIVTQRFTDRFHHNFTATIALFLYCFCRQTSCLAFFARAKVVTERRNFFRRENIFTIKTKFVLLSLRRTSCRRFGFLHVRVRATLRAACFRIAARCKCHTGKSNHCHSH